LTKVGNSDTGGPVGLAPFTREDKKTKPVTIIPVKKKFLIIRTNKKRLHGSNERKMAKKEDARASQKIQHARGKGKKKDKQKNSITGSKQRGENGTKQ